MNTFARVLLPLFALSAISCMDALMRPVGACEKELAADGLSELLVDTGAGALDIEGVAEGDAIRVRVELFTAHGSDQDAQLIEALRFELERVGEGQARLKVELPDDDFMSRADVTVTLPAELGLFVEDGAGDLSIRRVASLDLRDQDGDAVVEAVAGDVEIEDEAGDLSVQGVGGDLIVRDGDGNLEIREVTGAVFVDDGSGDVWIEAVGDQVTLRDQDGNATIARVGADVSVDDEAGDLTIERVEGGVDVRDGSGNLEISLVGQSVTITDTDGDIEVTHVERRVTIYDGAGDITVIDAGDVNIAADDSGQQTLR